jgi:serine/threonine protein phosphatase PrpC
VVADGVSTGKHSEEASRLVVELLRQQLTPLLGDDAQDIDMLLTALTETTRRANDQINERPYLSPGTADATTLVAVVCIGSEGAVCGAVIAAPITCATSGSTG